MITRSVSVQKGGTRGVVSRFDCAGYPLVEGRRDNWGFFDAL